MFTLFNLQGALGVFTGSPFRSSFFRTRGQLIYTSTSSSVCQELFSNSFELFLMLSTISFHALCASLERLHIILHQNPIVNTFFRIFSNYFVFVYFVVHCSENPQFIGPFV